MDKYLKVGVITTTHGLKGEVKVFPFTSDLDRFYDLDKCFLAKKDAKEDTFICVHCDGVKYFKNQVILHFEEYTDINQVEKYRQYEIWVSREDAIPLEDDEYYMTDLIDAVVKNEDGTEIGILKEIMETGANDVYVVKKSDGGELLIPAIHQCILRIDENPSVITVHLLEGMEE